MRNIDLKRYRHFDKVQKCKTLFKEEKNNKNYQEIVSNHLASLTFFLKEAGINHPLLF